jgi:hypothetical protein
MAADLNVELQWSPEVDSLIDSIDDMIIPKLNISLRDLLLNPEKFKDTDGIGDTLSSVKSSVDEFFDSLFGDLSDERKRLSVELERTNVEYGKINNAISSKTTSASIPYVKPLFIDSDPRSREEITIESYDEGFDALLSKFIVNSDYVADLSAKYNEYNLGSWVFSGKKVYVLTLNQPTSVIFSLEESRDTIVNLLNSVTMSITSQNQTALQNQGKSGAPQQPKQKKPSKSS